MKQSNAKNIPSRRPVWPYRQHDRRWRNIVMWDRRKVMYVAEKVNGIRRKDTECLLYHFPEGNTIGTEGCLITSLAMILAILDENWWNPELLNREAQECLYYTESGLSMTTLYADLCCEVSKGRVQLLSKEEYLPGEESWPKVYADTSPLMQNYRQLPLEKRKEKVAMIKIGTWDDTCTSHYLLVDPADPGTQSDRDFSVLDPAMPFEKRGKWKLSDAAKNLLGDKFIRREWKRAGIDSMQIGGVWLFGKMALAPHGFE